MKVFLLLLLCSTLSAQCIEHFDKTLIAKNYRCNSYDEVKISYRQSTVDITTDGKVITRDVLKVDEYVCIQGTYKAARIYADNIIISVIFDSKGLMHLNIDFLMQDNSLLWDRKDCH